MFILIGRAFWVKHIKLLCCFCLHHHFFSRWIPQEMCSRFRRFAHQLSIFQAASGCRLKAEQLQPEPEPGATVTWVQADHPIHWKNLSPAAKQHLKWSARWWIWWEMAEMVLGKNVVKWIQQVMVSIMFVAMAVLPLPLLRFARSWSVFLRVVVYSGASHGAVYYKRQGSWSRQFWGCFFLNCYRLMWFWLCEL